MYEHGTFAILNHINEYFPEFRHTITYTMHKYTNKYNIETENVNLNSSKIMQNFT